MSRQKEYAIYKGDDFIMIGTTQQCAEALGVKPETIRWMSTPANTRRNDSGERTIAVPIEEDEE